jgi:class 3 adenylate cyclase
MGVLWLDDALRLAGQSSDDSPASALDGLIRSLEEVALEVDIPYLKIVGDEIVFAAGLGGDPESGARGVAEMALGIRDHCDTLMGSGAERLRFRLGIDTGPVLGSAVGREGGAYNLWGEAALAARYMAQSGMSSSIQVTEPTYELLRGEFLFRARGRFFIEECGETSTYILADRL